MTDLNIDALFDANLSNLDLDELILLEKKVTEEANLNAYTLAIDYNIVDIELIERLEAKLGLINLVFTLSYFGGVNYADTLGTVAIWDSIIFRKLATRHIAIPPNTRSFKSDYAGGFVKEPQIGRHEWVMSFDLNSLYPNLIVQYNMSPETIVPHMKVAALQNGGEDKILNSEQTWAPEDNLAVAANGACFRRDKQGILPEIIEELYNQRVEVKRKMLEGQQERETLLEEYKKVQEQIKQCE